MLKGIHKKWKQTVCFTFCEGTTSTDQLASILKEVRVVRRVRKCGLQIAATISDQGATNQAAINRLIVETNKYFAEQGRENSIQGYLIDGIEIVHLFDFLHLMKCIRNMLLNKDLHFVQQGKRKVASWSHVMRLYHLDKSRGAYSQFVKLTEHVISEKIRTMKVKNFTQVFSHTVGTDMHVAARISSELTPESEFYLTPKAVDTADLLLFFDKLFDSVNGSAQLPPPGKNLKPAECGDTKIRTCFVLAILLAHNFFHVFYWRTFRSFKTAMLKKLGIFPSRINLLNSKTVFSQFNKIRTSLF
jgi:hypothetical protein